MAMEALSRRFETLESEGVKDLAELALHGLSKHAVTRPALALVRGGRRVADERLRQTILGIDFENPVMTGAGWDKKGHAVYALHQLGFAGTSVGGVPPLPQPGNPRPRLFYKDGVGLNHLGLNSPGMIEVFGNVYEQMSYGDCGVIAINAAKNKATDNQDAVDDYARVIDFMGPLADFFELNFSPNTPGLRELMRPRYLAEIIRTCKDAAKATPLLVKLDIDVSEEETYQIIDTCAEEGASGIVLSNTTTDPLIKARHDWRDKPGGLSGDDPFYQAKVSRRMSKITDYSNRHGYDLARIGAGGVNDAETAISLLKSGAQVVQLVTGIRQRGPGVANKINRGILDYLDKSADYDSVAGMVGGYL